ARALAAAGFAAPALVEPGQTWIEIAGQPTRGAAGETGRFGLAPRRGKRPAGRLADDLGIVTVGDDPPGTIGPESRPIERLEREAGRHGPEEAVAIIEVIGPFVIAEQIGPRHLDLDDGE